MKGIEKAWNAAYEKEKDNILCVYDHHAGFVAGAQWMKEQMENDIGRFEEKNIITIKILHLPVKAKWYKMQESGEKTEEYREINPYWVKRLCDATPFEEMEEGGSLFTLKRFTHVLFRYGYTRRCFIHRIDNITTGKGNPEWGAPTDREVFIIKHHKEESQFIVGKDYNV